jgi:hypothetical protein
LTTPKDAARRASYSREGTWDWRKVADALEVAWSAPHDRRTVEHSDIMMWPTHFIVMVRVRHRADATPQEIQDAAAAAAYRLRQCVHVRSQVVASKGFYNTSQLLAGARIKMSRATFDRCWRLGCIIIAEALNRQRAREDARMAA